MDLGDAWSTGSPGRPGTSGRRSFASKGPARASDGAPRSEREQRSRAARRQPVPRARSGAVRPVLGTAAALSAAGQPAVRRPARSAAALSRPRLPGPRAAVPPAALRPALWAVSYTHLRAHETRHDL